MYAEHIIKSVSLSSQHLRFSRTYLLKQSSEYGRGVVSCWKCELFGMAGMSSAGDRQIPKCTVQSIPDCYQD